VSVEKLLEAASQPWGTRAGRCPSTWSGSTSAARSVLAFQFLVDFLPPVWGGRIPFGRLDLCWASFVGFLLALFCFGLVGVVG
jgi:hypothetical protein